MWQRQTNYTNVGYRTNGTQELPSFIARGYNSLEKCSGQAALQNLGTSFSQVSKDPGSHFKRKRRLDSPYKDQSDKNESMKKKRKQNIGLAVGGLDGTPDKSKQEDEGVKPGYSVIDSQQHVDLGENDLSGPKTQPQFRHERSKNSCNSFNTNDYSLQTDNFKNLSIKEDASLPHALSDHPSLRSSHSLVSPRKMPHLLELSKERGINCKDSLAEGESEDFPQGEFQDNNPLTQNSKGDFENISRHGSEFSELNDGNKCVTFVPECVGKVITNFSVKKLQDILEQARKQDSIISEKNYEGSNGISEKSLKVACSLAKDSCHGNKIEKKCKKKAPVEVSEKRRSKTAVCGLAKASCHGNNVGKKSKKKAPVGVSKKKRSKTNKVPDGPKKKSGKKSRGEIRKSSSNVLPATSIETFSREQKLRKKKFMKLLELRKGEIEKVSTLCHLQYRKKQQLIHQRLTI